MILIVDHRSRFLKRYLIVFDLVKPLCSIKVHCNTERTSPERHFRTFQRFRQRRSENRWKRFPSLPPSPITGLKPGVNERRVLRQAG